MNDKTPRCVVDTGAVSSGGLHCQLVGCMVQHAPHVSYVAHFLGWLFG